MIVRITRVKVGNRQAPQQQTETPPKKVGFLRLRTTFTHHKQNGNAEEPLSECDTTRCHQPP
jgi:hypothetical protein